MRVQTFEARRKSMNDGRLQSSAANVNADAGWAAAACWRQRHAAAAVRVVMRRCRVEQNFLHVSACSDYDA